MSLVVEDGSGLSTAESYISVADASAHLTALGDTTFAAETTSNQEAALRRATQFMVQRYRSRWKGTRLLRDQALDWPRYGVEVDRWTVLSTIVPADIANACADLALKALTETLNPDLERGVKREKVGPLETEYDTYSPQAKRWQAVEQALQPYLRSAGINASLVRA